MQAFPLSLLLEKTQDDLCLRHTALIELGIAAFVVWSVEQLLYSRPFFVPNPVEIWSDFKFRPHKEDPPFIDNRAPRTLLRNFIF